MNKKEMRAEVRKRLSALDEGVRVQKSTMLALALVVHPKVREAGCVALFSPLPDEVQIAEAVEVLARERRVVLPRVEGDVMRFYPFAPEVMREGSYGILEPLEGEPVAPESIDVMVVPGVAFSSCGCRMGRGKGFYDKYMSQASFSAYKIGVCYAEQLSEALPCEEHDVKVDEVIYR